jgi:hypothetical protein
MAMNSVRVEDDLKDVGVVDEPDQKCVRRKDDHAGDGERQAAAMEPPLVPSMRPVEGRALAATRHRVAVPLPRVPGFPAWIGGCRAARNPRPRQPRAAS